MSEAAELNRKLDAMIEMATRTSQDVTWIKSGIERNTDRIDAQAADIAKVNNRVSRMQGSAGTFGAVAGTIFGGVIAFFVKTHS